MARTSVKPTPQKQMVQVQYRPLSALKKHPKNPRTIKDTSFKKLVTSIRENPDYFEARPIILSDRTGELIIIAGNQRFEAAKDIGIKDVPTALLPALTEEKEREIMIRDNIANGDWDWDALANEWNADDLIEWGLEIPDDWGSDSGVGNAGETDPDDVPEPEETAVSVLGDLWILGEHRLICGDSTDKPTVERLMNGQKADMVFTDPPYNVEIQGGCKGAIGSLLKKQGKKIDFISDFNPSVFLELLPIAFGVNYHNSYIFCNKDLLPDYLVWAKENKLSFNVLVWKKPGAIPIGGSHYPDIEYLLVFRKRAIWNGAVGGVSYSRLIEFNRESGLHPTMKPVDLIINQIRISSNHGSLILDFFLGSGSTLIACEKTGRQCYGIELDPKYCDVIIKRWQDFTGNQAILEATGETFEEVKNGRAS